MSLSCTLALSACLYSQAHWIPERDVYAILNTCPLVSQWAASEWQPGGWAHSTAGQLQDWGLRFEWEKSHVRTRANVLLACTTLERDAADSGKWKNLDKSRYRRR